MSMISGPAGRVGCLFGAWAERLASAAAIGSAAGISDAFTKLRRSIAAMRDHRQACFLRLAGLLRCEATCVAMLYSAHWRRANRKCIDAGKTDMRTILWLLLLPATLCGEELAPWNSNRASDRRAQAARSGHHGGTAGIPRRARRHDGRAELPLAAGSLDALRADLGIEPIGAHGKRRRDRRRQSVAVQRPQRLPQHQRDRRPGHRAGNDRQGEGHRPLVAADSASLSLSKATTASCRVP